MRRDPFIADGIFTGELRMRLMEKRLALGLSYARLEEILGVDWSTVRKWEKGLTRVCNHDHRRKLLDFVGGECDQRLRAAPEDACDSLVSRLPRSMQICMEKFAEAYMLCRGEDGLRRNLVGDIDRITSGILQAMDDYIGRSATS